MRLKIVVFDNFVTIDTPTSDEEGDFSYCSQVVSDKVVGGGIQANHEDPEWPEMMAVLDKLAVELCRTENLMP